ncbi:7 transmembrane receptor (rhodopsin family) [Popillia japonica]|uniref:7 transmembrane receptor (Rhodopsin family) n=1 Tax=Popillia japonica TaxID=7064 RepID=A0AAW1MKB9_POPJA
MILAIPAAIGSHLMYIEAPTITITVCYPFPPRWLNNKYPKVNVMAKFLALYVVPLAVIAIFYMNMANHLIVSTRNVPGEIQGTQRQIKARKKVAVTVLIFVLVFAVCFLPYHTFMLFFYFNPNAQEEYNDFWHYLRIVGFCLRYLNSCANPVALYWVSGAFRKHFNRYLLCMKPKRQRCDTCQGSHITSLSLSSKRTHSYCTQKSKPVSISTKKEHMFGQETSITLLGNGADNLCSKM